MGKREDLSGQKFHRISVLHESIPKTSPIKYECLCDCGARLTVRGTALKSGNTKSCGCLQRELVQLRATSHGESNTTLYKIFTSMRARCNTPSASAYSEYGAKGISVCSDWDSFEVFKEWASSNGYKEGLSIDRKESNKGYFPENCRWVSRTIQSRNRHFSKAATSKYKGVSWNSQYSKWTAIVCVDYKNKFLGRFTFEIDAAKARDQFIIDNKLEGFPLNFP